MVIVYVRSQYVLFHLRWMYVVECCCSPVWTGLCTPRLLTGVTEFFWSQTRSLFWTVSRLWRTRTRTLLTDHFPHIQTSCVSVFHRWWWWWICYLPIWHLRRCVWLRRRSHTILGPGRGPNISATLWWWGFTAEAFHLPAPVFNPRRLDRSPGLWTAGVISCQRCPGYLEPEEHLCGGAFWTVHRRAQALSPRPNSRLGGKDLNKQYFVCSLCLPNRFNKCLFQMELEGHGFRNDLLKSKLG